MTGRKRSPVSWGLGSLVLLGGASPASAHLVTTGLGPYYDGLGHLALTPEDLLAVLALALLAGLRGKEQGRVLLWVLPLSWWLGGLLGSALRATTSPWVGVVSLLAVGGLVASDVPLVRWQTLLIGALVGISHGLGNGGAMATSTNSWLALFGIVTGVFILFTPVTGFVTSLRSSWTRIAVRVGGSWMVAIGLLMAGWSMRGALI